MSLLLGDHSLIVLLRWVPESSREFPVEYLSWPLLSHLTEGTGSREPRLTWFLVCELFMCS